MTKARDLFGSMPSLPGAIPSEPKELFKLQRLCLRLYAQTTMDLDKQAQQLVEAAGSSLRKRDRQVLAELIAEELPVLWLIHLLDLMGGPGSESHDIKEMLEGLVVPCYALSYHNSGEEKDDPFQHVLNRLDWYLDGDKSDMASAFEYFLDSILEPEVKDPKPLLEHLRSKLHPEMGARLEVAYLYEFS